MTRKQFTLAYEKGNWWAVKDGDITLWKDGTWEQISDESTTNNFYTLEQCANELNRLNEENEQLKCGNKNLKAILNDFINICNRLQSNPNDKQTVAVARDMLQNMGVDLE